MNGQVKFNGHYFSVWDSDGLPSVQRGIPLNLLQRWLGHADITTTAIYAEAVGAEEKEIAARLWS